jgi:MFS transporter, ACS family, tartrate transporter
VEGFPAVLLSVIFLVQLPNTPDDARWLSSKERAWLAARLNDDVRIETHLEDRWGALQDPRIWQLGSVALCLLPCVYAYAFTVPTILQGVTGFSIARVGTLVAINGLLCVLSLTLNAMHSDRTRERRWHIAIPSLVSAGAFFVSGITKDSWWVVPALAVAIAGLYATQGILFAIPGSFLKGKSAATGIAIVTTMGILGGSAGPAWTGWMKDATVGYQIGLRTLAIPCLAGAAVMLVLKDRTRERKVFM